MKTIHCKNLNSAANAIDLLYDDDPQTGRLGYGADGEVFALHRVGQTTVYGWVLKLFNISLTSAREARIGALVELLRSKEQELLNDGLACLPYSAIKEDVTGRLGLVMRHAPGNNLDARGEIAYAVQKHGYDLAKRLSNAYEIARAVDALHRNGFVLGDLAFDNLILNTANCTMYLIDVDASGFSYEGITYPLQKNNSAKGTVSAPEKTNSYTVAMDLWSLAVILHNLLCVEDPITLFEWERKYSRKDFREKWPPPGHSQTAPAQDRLALLGQPLCNAFIRSFNEGRKLQSKRLKAVEWRDLLLQARSSVYSCFGSSSSTCDPARWYVPLGHDRCLLQTCPYCGSGIAPKPKKS